MSGLRLGPLNLLLTTQTTVAAVVSAVTITTAAIVAAMIATAAATGAATTTLRARATLALPSIQGLHQAATCHDDPLGMVRSSTMN